MKKIFAFFLAVVMTLCLIACAPEDTAATGADDSLELVDTGSGFRVGYARVDITPDQPVPMSGYGNNEKRVSQTILDRLYVTCVAVTDEQDNSLLLFSVDLQNTKEAIWQPARATLSQLTGIPENNMTLGATHTHSAVHQSAAGSNDYVTQWADEYGDKIVQCGVNALNDRKPATMQTGSVETEGLNFIRHYTTLSGGYVGDSFGSWDESPLTGHTTYNDPTMHIIRFIRDDAKDVVMANWRAHAGLTGGKDIKDLSADFVGAFREAIETMDDDIAFMYCQGAAGNVNPTSHIAGESAVTGTKRVQYREHGTLLAKHLMDGLTNNMTDTETGLVKAERRIVAGEVLHELEDKLLECKMVQQHYATYRDNNLTREYSMQFGIRTPYHANAIVSRSTMGETRDMELNALSIGEHVGFVTAPFEMFTSTSVETEEASPFDTTFVMGYSNSQNCYIPDDLAWEYTCYETDVTWYVQGTSNMIREQWLSMLDNLHGNAA